MDKFLFHWGSNGTFSQSKQDGSSVRAYLRDPLLVELPEHGPLHVSIGGAFVSPRQEELGSDEPPNLLPIRSRVLLPEAVPAGTGRQVPCPRATGSNPFDLDPLDAARRRPLGRDDDDSVSVQRFFHVKRPTA